MLAKERQGYILQKLRLQPTVTAAQLAEELGCSRSTIQRDLRELDLRGEVQREFGGAMRPATDTIISGLNESALESRLERNTAAKRLIAAEALKEVQDGGLVFIDSGSTPLFVLPGLADKRVIVVTNSVAAAHRLTGTQVEIYLLGGQYEAKHQITSGAITVREIHDFRFDLALLGANGVDVDLGEAFVSDYQLGEIKRNVIARSKRAVLLVDDTKFDFSGVCRFAMLDDFDRVFVNRPPEACPLPYNFVVCT